MSSWDDFNEVIGADQNHILVANADPLNVRHWPSIAVIASDYERMELSGSN